MTLPSTIGSPAPPLSGQRNGERRLRLPLTARTLAVVAPHPDDETLAAGGLIFDLNRAGWRVTIVVVTDGAASHPDVRNLSALREVECRRAVRQLGVSGRPTFLRFPDGEAQSNVGDVAAALRQALANVDLVVAPRADDGHSDHEATAQAIEMALDASGPPLLKYAIWGWEQLDAAQLNVDAAVTFRPTAEAMRAKRRALRHYQSQTTARYGRTIVGDAVLRRHNSATEVFWW